MDDVTRGLRGRSDDINPRFNWGRHLPALGMMGVTSRSASTIGAFTSTASAGSVRRSTVPNWAP
jgi:hypothetical protein